MAKKNENKKIVPDKKGKIIEQATILFFEAGYDKASIRELAEATDLSLAGIYYFFKDKNDILFSILYQSVVDLNVTIKTAIIEGDDPKKNIERLIESLLRHVIRHRMEISILNREDGRLSVEQKEIITRKRREAYALIKKELTKLADRGEMKKSSITTAAFMLFSMTTWFVRWYHPDGSLTLEEIATDMVDVFFHGLLR